MTRATSPSSFPLSALLSQVLVAFTVEFDNAFELRMAQSGYAGARLSLVVWANLMRFLAAGGLPVRDLAQQTPSPQTQVKFGLGCLERWVFIKLRPGAVSAPKLVVRITSSGQSRALRDGWGSARGIRADWMVLLTQKGERAAAIWPSLFEEIEHRWRSRFGHDRIETLRQSLQAVVEKFDLELPQAVPADWHEGITLPARTTRDVDSSLPTLLSQVLAAFALEFDAESKHPLDLCANVLRVLGNGSARVADLPELTGASPERTAIGWRLAPYVAVASDPTGRRPKLARLTPLGQKAQQNYGKDTRLIERRWASRFGEQNITRLRQSLLNMYEASGDSSPLSAGMMPPAGVVRAGDTAPSLGRKKVTAVARQRGRDLMIQTEAYVRDPAGCLPHFPLWDMNRGFGP